MHPQKLTLGIYYTNTTPLSTIIYAEFGTKLCFFPSCLKSHKLRQFSVQLCRSLSEEKLQRRKKFGEGPTAADALTVLLGGIDWRSVHSVRGRKWSLLLIFPQPAASSPTAHMDPGVRRRKRLHSNALSLGNERYSA